MSQIIEINDKEDSRLAPFRSLTEAQLRSALFTDEPLIIVESPKVIRVALSAGLKPVSLLCERRHIEGDAADIIAKCQDMPVYTGSRELLASITGYTLTRGVLCAMRRPVDKSASEVCAGARRIAVIVDVCDTTNIGAIFRSAAALGIDGILLTGTSCDPFNRRSIRVSMGSVFLIPWAFIGQEVNDELHSLGFKTAAMALTEKSVAIDNAALNAEERLAIMLGTEGEGLPKNVIEGADYTVRIPMSNGVDSLNVGAAAAIAFWQLKK